MIKATIDGNVYEDVKQITASDGSTTKVVSLTEIIEGGNSVGLSPMFSVDFEVSELNFGNTGTGNITGTGTTVSIPSGAFPNEGRLYLIGFVLKNPTIAVNVANSQTSTLYPIEYWSFSCGSAVARVEHSNYPNIKLGGKNSSGLFFWAFNQSYRPYLDTVYTGKNPTSLNILYRLSGATDNRYKMQAGTWTLKVYDITDSLI